jgi:hypothetical protein
LISQSLNFSKRVDADQIVSPIQPQTMLARKTLLDGVVFRGPLRAVDKAHKQLKLVVLDVSDRNFIQRRYQDFLTRNYIPILEQIEGRKWQVTNAQDSFSSSFRQAPDIDPRHLQGSLVKGGKKVGVVDVKGQFA